MTLNHRKDTRSVQVFKSNLLDFHQREKLWISIYAEELRQNKHKVEVEDFGVDNTGKLIKDSLPNHNPDYKLIIDGVEQLIEVKTCPENSPTFTFKVGSLKTCIEHNSLILVPKSGVYYIIEPPSMEHLLETLPHAIYHSFSPNDICIRFTTKKMIKYVENHIIQQYAWSSKAKKLIDKKSDILFRKKKK